jgi:hypothetical protein
MAADIYEQQVQLLVNALPFIAEERCWKFPLELWP